MSSKCPELAMALANNPEFAKQYRHVQSVIREMLAQIAQDEEKERKEKR